MSHEIHECHEIHEIQDSYSYTLVVVSNVFYFHPYLGKIPILTNIFQTGWDHQLGYTLSTVLKWGERQSRLD